MLLILSAEVSFKIFRSYHEPLDVFQTPRWFDSSNSDGIHGHARLPHHREAAWWRV